MISTVTTVGINGGGGMGSGITINTELTSIPGFYYGSSGRGCGASHQTGWTGLIAQILIGLGEGYTANFQPPE